MPRVKWHATQRWEPWPRVQKGIKEDLKSSSSKSSGCQGSYSSTVVTSKNKRPWTQGQTAEAVACLLLAAPARFLRGLHLILEKIYSPQFDFGLELFDDGAITTVDCCPAPPKDRPASKPEYAHANQDLRNYTTIRTAALGSHWLLTGSLQVQP